MLLSEQCYQKIDRELAKYPADQRQSAVMAALAHAQLETVWISPALMQELADYIRMPAIAVQEVATFYNMYNTKLGIDYRDTTADGQLTLMEGECMGACGDAPVMLVNNHRMCSWMSNEKIDALVEELKQLRHSIIATSIQSSSRAWTAKTGTLKTTSSAAATAHCAASSKRKSRRNRSSPT